MPFARPDLIWSTDRVAAALGRPDVRVVDCRAALTPEGTIKDMRDAYLAGHLPGAVHCQWTFDLSAPPPAAGHPRYMLLGAAEFATVMSRLGIGERTTVIGYDNQGGHMAARLWLALRRYGHDRFALMDGGIQRWQAEGRPLETGDGPPPAPAVFTSRPREGVLASLDEVLAAVRTGDPWLLDVRREGEYLGDEARAKRGGHIPGAVHLPWESALTAEWRFKDPDLIEAMYADAGFNADTATIAYCQAGARAAFTHLVLTALGHDDVRTYDGSWEEYGNREDVPVVRGRS